MESLKRDLEKLYDEFRQPLFTCALAVTKCRDLAEDAMHEAFCRLLRAQEIPRNLKGYVFRSVRNAALDLLRRGSRMVEAEADYIFNSSSDPRKLAETREFQQRVAEGLLMLCEDERETIIQHLYAELTFREIAEMRDCPIGTVTSWYRRGLARLREIVGE
jgi:RNA polymerase sigma-70 factor (ECF subfamily)